MNTLYCKGYVKPTYPVYISDNPEFNDLRGLLPNSQKRVIVVDEKIAQLFPELLSGLENEGTYIFPIGASEDNKSFSGLENLLAKIFPLKLSRDDILIAIGGGLVMNLAGLAGSLIMRGIRFYYVPTTLTGQIDASMGSKQAVNFMGAKNWIGMFNDPEFCYVNPSFLNTTSQRDFNSQAIEGVKLCLATNRDLFLDTYKDLGSLSPQNVSTFITKMIQTKIAVVEQDLTEENYGMSMLYGHTIGHAVEMLDHRHINHGEGVGLGMLAAARISYMMGLAPQELVATHEEVLNRLGLPNKIPKHITVSDIMQKLAHNKKNYGGKVRFVLLRDIGEMAKSNENYFMFVPDKTIIAAVEEGY